MKAFTVNSRDVSNHWIECLTVGCLETKENGAHDLSTGACICGLAHTHSWEVAYDRVNHYEECVCGETQNAVAHTVENGACSCGYSALRYGQDELWTHDGVLADIRDGNTLTYNNVAIPAYTAENNNIIRLQVIPERIGVSSKAPYGARILYVTLQDVTDTSKFITIMVRSGTPDGAETLSAIAVTTNDLNGVYYGRGHGQDTMLAKPDDYCCLDVYFSMTGAYLGGFDVLTIAMDGTKVYCCGKLVWDLSDFSSFDLTSEGSKDGSLDYSWTPFSGNVNVIVSCADYTNGATLSTVWIDTLCGAALNADSVSNFTLA